MSSGWKPIKVASTDIGKGVHGWEGTLIRRLGFVPSAATDIRHMRKEARHPLLDIGVLGLLSFAGSTSEAG